jgi:hypothetical protein
VLSVAAAATFSVSSVAAVPKQDLAFEIFYDGAWRDLVADDDVLTEAPIVIQRGQGDESPAPRPAQITATLANDDDRYRTSNPYSPLYGKAGRNTPTRVSVAGVVRGTGQASTWRARQSRDFRAYPRRGSAAVDVEAGGILEQINGWSEPVKSPMRAWNETYADTTVGYFPLEDPPGTLSVSTPTPGATVRNGSVLKFQAAGRPAGSDLLAEVSPGESTGFNFVQTGQNNAGYQLSWTSRHDAIRASGTTSLINWGSSQTDYALRWEDNGDISLLGVDVATEAIVVPTTPVSVGDTLDYQDWNLWRLRVTESGGTVSVELSWIPEGGTGFVGFTWTYAGAASGQLGYANILLGSNGEGIGPKYGHVLGLTTGADNLESSDRVDAFNGHAGETAGARFGRLMDLYDIDYTVIGTEADSMPMGAQGSAQRLPDLLEEIGTTEDGLIFDDVDAIGLVFLLRNARYNQSPAVVLYPEDLPVLPTEVTDKLDVHNIVTVSQKDGGEATARDDTGPLGTQAPPDGVNEERQTVDVNIADVAALPQVANWWLRRGTVNLPRFPQLVVNLAVLSPSKIAEVEAVDVGSVLTIVGFREYTIRLYVLGYTEAVGTHSRTITFVCALDQQFQTGVYDGTERLANPNGSVTVGTYTRTFGTITVTRPGADWSTATPYRIVIGGEEMRVNSVFDSGANQGLNVTRSVNGISLTHEDGEPVELAIDQRARYAL